MIIKQKRFVTNLYHDFQQTYKDHYEAEKNCLSEVNEWLEDKNVNIINIQNTWGTGLERANHWVEILVFYYELRRCKCDALPSAIGK